MIGSLYYFPIVPGLVCALVLVVRSVGRSVAYFGAFRSWACFRMPCMIPGRRGRSVALYSVKKREKNSF